MIRIGFVCDSLEIGGQERGFLDVLRRLDRGSFAPHLYLFRPGTLLPEAQSLGVPIAIGHDKPGADDGWTGADDTARQHWRERLAGLLRRDRIDVCVVYAWRDGIPAAEAAGVRAIVERLDGPTLSTRIRDKSACRRIICESRMARRVLLAQHDRLGCRRDRIVVVPNGIDLVRFDPARYDRPRCRAALGLTADEYVVGYVGRLAAEKNVTQLLRGVRYALDHDRGGQRLVVVVAGPDCGAEEELRDEVARLGIADRVRFLGARGDVPEILRALDVFALTSLYEGTPFSLLEAMAMGLPVIATQVGAIVEVVRDNGFLVPVLQPEDVGRALIELHDTPPLAAKMARRSRQLAVRRHEVGAMIARYEDVFTDALRDAQQPPVLERAL